MVQERGESGWLASEFWRFCNQSKFRPPDIADFHD